jgi:hypothetical protein
VRRIVFAAAGTVTGLVLLLSHPTSLNRSATVGAVDGSAGGGSTPSRGGSTADGGALRGDGGGSTSGSGISGTFTGETVHTRYGAVQVEISVVDGTITTADAVRYPEWDHERSTPGPCRPSTKGWSRHRAPTSPWSPGRR